MRITDRYQSLMERPGAGAAKPVVKTDEAGAANGSRGGTATSATGANAPAIQVKVSARAQELAAGSARLEELKASVKAGTFKIDADKIAAKLVGDE